jgi:hypothetical protein
MAYESAGDLLHALQALCNERAFRAESAAVPDPAAADHWRRFAADSEREWKGLEPGNRPGVEDFAAECRRQIQDLRGVCE